MAMISWKAEMNTMLAAFNRQAMLSLENIKVAFKQNGLPFNDEFRQYFLQVSNKRIEESYDQFEMDSKLEDRFNHSVKSINSSTPMKPNQNKNNIANDELTRTSNSIQGENVGENTNCENVVKTGENVKSVRDTSKMVTVNEKNSSKKPDFCIEIIDSDDEEEKSSTERDVPVSSRKEKDIPENGANKTMLDYFAADESMKQNKGEENHGKIKINIKREKDNDNEIGAFNNARIFVRVATKNIGNTRFNNYLNPIEIKKETYNSDTGVETRKRQREKSSDMNAGASKSKKSSSDTQGKKFKCQICGREVKSKCNLDRHMLLHTGEKQFNCNKCGKGFPRKDYIKRHKC